MRRFGSAGGAGGKGRGDVSDDRVARGLGSCASTALEQ